MKFFFVLLLTSFVFFSRADLLRPIQSHKRRGKQHIYTDLLART